MCTATDSGRCFDLTFVLFVSYTVTLIQMCFTVVSRVFVVSPLLRSILIVFFNVAWHKLNSVKMKEIRKRDKYCTLLEHYFLPPC